MVKNSFLFINSKEKIQDIVLVDTNIVIGLENIEPTKNIMSAVNFVFKNEIRPFITELSFSELILGCKSIENLHNHYTNLDNIEFLILYSYKPLSTFLANYDIFQIRTDQDLINFKNNVAKIRDNKLLFPMLFSLFMLYLKLSVLVFEDNDKEYWGTAIYIAYKLLSEKNINKSFKKLIFNDFNIIFYDPKDSKKIISVFFREIMIVLIMESMPNKYKREELEKKIIEVLKPSNYECVLSKLQQSIKIKKNIKSYKYVNFISRTLKFIDLNDDYPVLSDGLCFICSKIIFNNGGFHRNDLIDLYNIYIASKQELNIHYFTDDTNDWSLFIEVEKNLRPNIKILFNE